MTNSVLKLLQRNIKKYRIENGLTQVELAVESDLSVDFISGIERGVRLPSMEAFVKIAKALGVEPCKFFMK